MTKSIQNTESLTKSIQNTESDWQNSIRNTYCAVILEMQV